jgi:hypothetical protein
MAAIHRISVAKLYRSSGTSGIVLALRDAKTVYQDIHQTQDVGLPSGLVVREAHADERADQVFGLDIGPYLAVCDCALQKIAGSLCQLLERARVKFRASCDRNRECLDHALLGGDELNPRSKPSTERLDGRRFILQLLCEVGELFNLMPIHRLIQSFARGEVTVQRSNPDARAPSHGFKARIRAAGTEDGGRGPKEALAITRSIRAQSESGLDRLCPHVIPVPVANQIGVTLRFLD